MLYEFSWWDLIPLPFLIMGIRASYMRKVDEIGSRATAGWFSLFSIAYLIIDAIRHRTGYAVFDAGMVAAWVYLWWTSGGGTNVKNYIKSFGMKPAPIAK